MSTNTIFLIIGIIIISIILIRLILSTIIFNILKKSLPPISDTEREAIEAGTLSYEERSLQVIRIGIIC